MPDRVKPDWPNEWPCQLAFVGEAPGEDEMDQGVPLVGPSGKVFNAMLRTAGIDRAACLVTNVFDTKAPDNDVSGWMRDPEVWGPALDRLEAELAKADPTVIVPLGGTALWALTEDPAITMARGAVGKARRVAPGKKLVPTFHPAMVMRSWKMFPVAVGDLVKAKREADLGPDIVWPKRRLVLEPTLADLDAYWPMIEASDLLSVDIETGWGQITCIGFAPDQENAICVPFVDFRKPSKSFWGSVDKELSALMWVKKVMESPVPKLGQNFGAYDAFWLLDRYGIRTINLTDDTRLIHHALYPELPKDLSFMGASYGRQGVWKTWGGGKSDKRDD